MARGLTGARPPLIQSDRLSPRSNINDNYCVPCVAGNPVFAHVTGKGTYSVKCVTGNRNCACVSTGKDSLVTELTGKDCFVTNKKQTVRTLTVNSCPAVKHVHFAKEKCKCYLSPEIKHVNDVSFVDQLSSVKCVTNVPTVAPNPPVGARLLQFWEKWAALGISFKTVTVLKEGYTLPFSFWPNLTRSPNIISCYVNPHRHLYLLEALHQLLNKNAVKLVTTQTSLCFTTGFSWSPNPTSGGDPY